MADEREDQPELPLDEPTQQESHEPSRSDIIEAGKKAGWFDRKRDDSGRFAPKDERGMPTQVQVTKPEPAKTDAKVDAKPADKPAPEPFSGFNALPDAAKAEFNRLRGERDQFKNDYASMVGKMPGLQRELSTLKQQQQRPQTQQQQRDVSKQLEKFEAFKQRFPDDAGAIQELVDAVRNDLSQQTQMLPDLLNEVQRLRGESDNFQAEKTRLQAERVSDQLSREHPNWKQIAGWEDDKGNPVPTKDQKWHPWYAAWKDSLHPEIAADYDTKMNSMNATLIGHVLSHFERDVQSVVDNSGQQQDDQSASGQPNRREEALRDISPRPTRTGAEPQTPIPGRTNGQDGERAAVLSQYLNQWMGRPTR